jgi:hypothetical protein
MLRIIARMAATDHRAICSQRRTICAFQQGQLNLMGSLIGLSERQRYEQAL